MGRRRNALKDWNLIGRVSILHTFVLVDPLSAGKELPGQSSQVLYSSSPGLQNGVRGGVK
jgi:hypothetical protein